jgi:amino acid adenylation domain-containing protein
VNQYTYNPLMRDVVTSRALGSGFLESSDKFPERTALEVGGETFSYRQVREQACSIAITLQTNTPDSAVPLTAVLAHRSFVAFCGILGAIFRGHGYVPLNPYFPVQRTAAMLEHSGCRSIVVGNEAIPALKELLPTTSRSLVVIIPASTNATDLSTEFPGHTFIYGNELRSVSNWRSVEAAPDEIAYLLFTSGSTGQPKGVPVTHANIRRFLDVVTDRYAINQSDRFSQMFELVFDLSLFDLFAAWENGACVCCPNPGEAQLPAKYIIDSKITVWFSVPSLALSMKRTRMLTPGLYPGLRLSLFCGEALLEDVVEHWTKAAPHTVIENLYGPTEVTLACTAYRWDPERSPNESEHGIVPIGSPFPGVTTIVVDENLAEIAPGEPGELLLSGAQVVPGYWNDPQKTATGFVIPPGRNVLFYRTGDLVRRPGAGQPLKYLGRIDQQIKIRGNRVELGEIEAALRDAAGVDIAVAIGWPVTPAGADGIVAFLGSRDVALEHVREQIRRRLPAYMVPRQIYPTDNIPLNPNGKVDRKALIERLDGSM